MQAATYAANGMGATIGPATGRMRGAASRGLGSTTSAFTPMVAAYRAGALDAQAAAKKSKGRLKAQKKGKRMSRNRVGMLMGMLAVGAAVGAGSALMMRRRRRQQWSEYDPSQALESMRSETEPMGRPTGEPSMRSRMDENTTAEKSDDFITRSASRNSRP